MHTVADTMEKADNQAEKMNRIDIMVISITATDLFDDDRRVSLYIQMQIVEMRNSWSFIQEKGSIRTYGDIIDEDKESFELSSGLVFPCGCSILREAVVVNS